MCFLCLAGCPGGLHGLLPERESVAPVEGGEQATNGDHQAAEPDPAHVGLVVETQAPVATTTQAFTQRYVDVAHQAGVDAGLGHRLGLHCVGAFFGRECCHFLAFTGDRDAALVGPVVRALHGTHAIEAEGVAGHVDGLARRHTDILLDIELGDEGDTDNEHGDA